MSGILFLGVAICIRLALLAFWFCISSGIVSYAVGLYGVVRFDFLVLDLLRDVVVVDVGLCCGFLGLDFLLDLGFATISAEWGLPRPLILVSTSNPIFPVACREEK